MMTELSKADKPNLDMILEPLMPVCLSFGPLFMYLGLSGIVATQRIGGVMLLFDHLFAIAGVLGVSAGLLFLFTRQIRTRQRLDKIEGLQGQGIV